MATHEGSSPGPTRWLSKATLDELVRLADKSPKEFNLHFKRLDIRRKLQVRRYLLERFRQEGHPIPAILLQSIEAEPRTPPPPPSEPSVATPTIGDLLDESESEDALPLQGAPTVDDGRSEAESSDAEVSLADLFAQSEAESTSVGESAPAAALEGLESLEALFRASEENATPSEVDSLERLFATSDSPSSESESVSLDALFAEEASSETERSALVEPTPPTEEAPTGPIPVVVEPSEVAEFLKNNPVFEGMDDRQLEEIVSRITAVRYPSDAVICREGDPGNEMWIIREGGIRVSVRGKTVVDLGPGAPVGEMSILDGKPRSTDLIALDHPLLYVFTREAYAEIFRLDIDAGSKLVSNIVGIQQTRLRNTTQQAIENAVAAERAEGELRRAKETQDLALPKNNHPSFGASEFYVFYKGARGVSGDYYDFIQLPDQPDQLIVIMGDSTGHGLNAGLEMLLAKSASFTQVASDPSVEKITAAVNNITCYIFGATMFMTFVCAMIDREKHTIRYTNAGQQSHPYLYRMKTDEFVPLESQIFQLGITPGVEYTSEEITYEDGDLLIFYSDGITEAPYCPEGATDVDRSQEFGDERLRELIRQNAHRTPKEIAEKLLEEVKAFCRFYDSFEEINGAVVDGDDITNIVIRLG